jgi:hypothetical protein
VGNAPEYWEQLSQGAIERARDFLWPRLGEKLAEVYRQVLANRK